jgi:hypothetical protein
MFAVNLFSTRTIMKPAGRGGRHGSNPNECGAGKRAERCKTRTKTLDKVDVLDDPALVA